MSCTGQAISDLRVYDLLTMIWTDLSTPRFGTPPSARACHGFTSDGGRLYVFGGYESFFGGVLLQFKMDVY